MKNTDLIRTSVFLTRAQVEGLMAIVASDPVGGLKPARLIRQFVAEGLNRLRKRSVIAE